MTHETAATTDEYMAPEHSDLCVCDTCAPANRGRLERIIAEHDAMIDALDAPRVR